MQFFYQNQAAAQVRPKTIVFLGALGILCWFVALYLDSDRRPGSPWVESEAQELIVYCAAGIRKPVAEAAKAFEEEYGVVVRLDYGSSGELEGKLELERAQKAPRCDLYIPADLSFSQRAREKGLIAEHLTLASFQLVLAMGSDEELPTQSLSSLATSGLRYGICDEKAGAGQKTREALKAFGLWESTQTAARATFPRVTELAGAILSSDVIQAGFIWDSTAHQFGLKIIPTPELENIQSTISANVSAQSRNPTWALRLARYLSAVDKGAAFFAKHHYSPANGDRWSLSPSITFYCGGVNREAISPSIKAFEKREGCVVETQFAGCGTLIGSIRSGPEFLPDLFMTCDASYLSMVADDFLQPRDVSSTRVCMLVRKGNPNGIRQLSDLEQADLKIGTTDPAMSTLGALSHAMFEELGIASSLRKQQSIIVTTPTAHELILQMEGHDKLDVALVYEANCQHLGDHLEIIPIDHPLARATQNMASGKTSAYPQLMERFMNTILSDQSMQSFLHQGFEWIGLNSKQP